jgi:hypothetical protein
MAHDQFDNQHLAPSLDFSSTHKDAIGYHSQNEAMAVVLQQIIPPSTETHLLLRKILVLFYVTTPTPPSTTPTISNQPFTCQISQAQDQPECSQLSAQHSHSILAHTSTPPDIVFGIPYNHADVNPGNYSSSNKSLSRHINSRHCFLASCHGLHLAKYSLPASNCSTGIPSIPGIVSARSHCNELPGNYSHHPTSRTINSSNHSNYMYITSPQSSSTEIASNNVGS